MTAATSALLLLAIFCVHREADAVAQQAFLSKDNGKKRASALDSPVVRERLEALSGKKVDPEKLKTSFAQDKWAGLKTVLGSAPLFNFLQLDRGTPWDKDNSVSGLELVEQKTEASNCDSSQTHTPCEDELAKDKLNAPKKTPPLVEFQMEMAALPKIYNDINANKEQWQQIAAKQAAAESAGPLKAMGVVYELVRTGKIVRTAKDPLNAETWTTAIEDDEEVQQYLERPENDVNPPKELDELSDIPDWLTNKI